MARECVFSLCFLSLKLPLISSLTLLTAVKHLYLLDFDPTHIPSLRQTMSQKYPNVGVSALTDPLIKLLSMTTRPCAAYPQASFIQGDAASPDLIESTCNRAIAEQGRLDFFFANVSSLLDFHSSLLSRMRS